MKIKYHILNGDCLKEEFPATLEGRKIIARLCLVDGDVKADSLSELFKIRAKFISDNYGKHTEECYFEKTVPEIEKIQNIPDHLEINLWFEDDLFCQVNFWFVVNLLYYHTKSCNIYLIRPKEKSKYSFSSMVENELVEVYTKRKKIEPFDFNELRKLWGFYQHDNIIEMLRIARKLDKKYPFLIPAIQAHEGRMAKDGNLGRPKNSLIQIISDLKTNNFGQIFRAFSKREEIYGFSDLQVKRLYDELINSNIKIK
ncbi:MAG: hypothetical protein V3V00_01895 [Saprospiraceae bacterium]